jgi:hypothetical protein
MGQNSITMFTNESSASSGSQPPTFTRLLAGSSTYTPPNTCVYIIVHVQGGGGGGGIGPPFGVNGVGTNGGIGAASTFGTTFIIAFGGNPGLGGSDLGLTGTPLGGLGAGCTVITNLNTVSTVLTLFGGDGISGAFGGSMIGGGGGYSVFAGAAHGSGRNTPSGFHNAIPNSGAGGGGAVNGLGGNSGGGGGAGGYGKVLINFPTSYPFSVAVGGSGGYVSGPDVFASNGGSGQILVEEYY